MKNTLNVELRGAPSIFHKERILKSLSNIDNEIKELTTMLETEKNKTTNKKINEVAVILKFPIEYEKVAKDISDNEDYYMSVILGMYYAKQHMDNFVGK